MTEDSPTVLIYSTAPSREVAEDIAHHLVASRLIACANILPQMIAVYRWEGNVETGEEVAMILKTRRDKAAAVVAKIEARHPYDTPAAVVIETAGGSAPFLKWIASETERH